MTCNWNKTTKQDIEPKMIRDLVTRQKLHSNAGKNGNNENVNPEDHCQDELQSFNPVLSAF